MIKRTILFSAVLAAGTYGAAFAQEDMDTDDMQQQNVPCDPATENCDPMEEQMEPSAGAGETPAHEPATGESKGTEPGGTGTGVTGSGTSGSGTSSGGSSD